MPNAERRDLITVLTQDHRDIEDLFTARQKVGSQDPDKELVETVATLMESHTAAEAQYLYPSLRLHVPEGDNLADREIRGHSEIGMLLKTLDGLGSHDDDFGPTLVQLTGALRAHFAEEEALLFPKVAAHCSSEQLAVLGAMVSAGRSEY